MANKFRVIVLTLILGINCISLAPTALAQEQFYKGKTIRFVVGFAAGGGFDTYTRAIARHIGKHIPGSPSTVVENMPGAGSLIAANFVYNQAAPDGLTIGNWIGTMILQQYLGAKGVAFDTGKFGWVGAPARINNVCALTKRSGITSVDTWLASKAPVKMGAEAPGSTTADIPRILTRYTKLPIQLVEGYKGTADIRIAAEAGEVAGFCGAWEAIKPTWSKALESGEAVVVVQAVGKPHADLPNVPLAVNLIQSDEGRQIMKVAIHDIGGTLNRPYSLPPATPKDRLQILRNAFQATLKDPAFLAEAQKAKLDIDPVSGGEIEETVAEIRRLPAGTFARMKEILLPHK